MAWVVSDVEAASEAAVLASLQLMVVLVAMAEQHGKLIWPKGSKPNPRRGPRERKCDEVAGKAWLSRFLLEGLATLTVAGLQAAFAYLSCYALKYMLPPGAPKRNDFERQLARQNIVSLSLQAHPWKKICSVVQFMT